MSRRFPRPRLALASVGALVVLLAGGYLVLIGPKRHHASQLAAQADDLRRQIAETQASSSSSDTQPIRIADIFQLSRAMPDTPDVPDVLLQLSQVATETGITFSSITPAKPELVGNYQKLPIDLTFQGRFYDLSDFLYRLRNLVGVHDGALQSDGRLFAIDSISFAEGDVTFPQVQANLRVDAYIFGNGLEPSPPPAGASAQSAVPAAPTSTQSSSALPTESSSTPVPIAPKGASAAPAGGTR
jgi:hypothetical protein